MSGLAGVGAVAMIEMSGNFAKKFGKLSDLAMPLRHVPMDIYIPVNRPDINMLLFTVMFCNQAIF